MERSIAATEKLNTMSKKMLRYPGKAAFRIMKYTLHMKNERKSRKLILLLGKVLVINLNME
jgi:hypothetical protein